MKLSIFSILILICLSLITCNEISNSSPVINEESYYPISVGSYWVYEKTEKKEKEGRTIVNHYDILTEKIDRSQTIDGEEFFYKSKIGKYESTARYLYIKNSKVYAMTTPITESWYHYYLYNKQYSENQKWTYYDSLYEVLEYNIEYKIDDKNYNNVVKIKIYSKNASTITEQYFAKGIGLIYEYHSDPNRNRSATKKLIEYNIK